MIAAGYGIADRCAARIADTAAAARSRLWRNGDRVLAFGWRAARFDRLAFGRMTS